MEEACCGLVPSISESASESPYDVGVWQTSGLAALFRTQVWKIGEAADGNIATPSVEVPLSSDRC